MKKILLVIMALFSLIFISTTNASAGKGHSNSMRQVKVDVCHFSAKLNNSFIISIALAAVNSHIRHGDYLVGEEICNGIDDDCDGDVDEECQPSEVSCYDISDVDPSVCSGQGVCIGMDTCECYSGFAGEECEEVLPVECFGILAEDSFVCSGQGACVATDTCECDLGFAGEECEEVFSVECFGILAEDPFVCSGQGACVAMDTCDCESGFTGDQCDDDNM